MIVPANFAATSTACVTDIFFALHAKYPAVKPSPADVVSTTSVTGTIETEVSSNGVTTLTGLTPSFKIISCGDIEEKKSTISGIEACPNNAV